MAELIVHRQTLTFQNKTYRCAIGKGGLIAAENKREGDGCTPIGRWRLRECWYRADRLEQPETKLPVRMITPEDGWCDDSASEVYNRHFKLTPFPLREERSFEHLWREDCVYDLIIPLGYNDDPVIPGKGSAIFLHIAREHYEPTEGCVALAKLDLLALLPHFSTNDELVVLGGG